MQFPQLQVSAGMHANECEAAGTSVIVKAEVRVGVWGE